MMFTSQTLWQDIERNCFSYVFVCLGAAERTTTRDHVHLSENYQISFKKKKERKEENKSKQSYSVIN